MDWKIVDEQRIGLLYSMLAERGLLLLGGEQHVQPGSLWEDARLQQLGRIWHRLPPWPDTCRGLDLLKKQYSTVTLSNADNDILVSMVKNGKMPFEYTFSADMWKSTKPDPKVYLGAAEKIGVKPEQCALVAAHLGDLKGAKACGFYAIYVERPLEEKKPELKEDRIPDLVIREDEDGLISLAHRLGTSCE